ncbi:hypothetical protein [Rhizobium phaseoli]|uniref:hypothetical protein n=1 Tax=Rhizobium phaseoli TaxID=396 RepID=UPI00143861DD|nr:hypothetical protein [Rhizobium phaseoli]MDK4728764.1 hypothetical protein [Rhizobium phaseoli]NKE86846.1 hypothetical protein [Rhizobium phaseoli]
MEYIDFELTGFVYDPQHFRELRESELGQAVYEFMVHPVNVVRMQTATELERVAVEPLGKYLVEEFGEDVVDDRVKQYIGHLARQIMECIGYKHDRKALQITRPGLFSSGSTYRNEAKPEMRINAEQRAAWLKNTSQSPFNQWLDGQVRTNGKLDLAKLYAVAKKYGIEKRYDHLNPGQQRMNIGVLLRKKVKFVE